VNTVTVTDSMLLVEPQGLNKLWSLTRKLEFPLAHVRGATFDPGASNEAKGLRHPGLAVPGKWVGTFTKDGDTSFWNVAKQDKTIVVQLQDDEFERLYLTVEDPRGTVDLINAALEQPNQS
jgi:hypothetical protein